MAYLRQICTLDVSEAALVPAVLQEFSALLNLDMCCFNWLSSDGSISHAHTAGLLPPVEMVERYALTYVNRDESEMGITTRQRLHRSQILSGSRDLGRRFLNTVAYNEFALPIDIRFLLNASIFSGADVVATIACQRMADQREFGATDDRQLAHALPYLALASAPRPPTEESTWSEESERGVLVIDTRGGILHTDALALSRLYRATRRTRAADRGGIDAAMRAPLQQLARQLRQIDAGEAVSAPDIRLFGEGRRFDITARALRADPAKPLELIAVSVAEWVPGALRVLPWLRKQGLSLRQRELTLHLYDGRSVAEAACVMGIAPRTAEDYLSLVYEKLAVKSREALLLRLHMLAVAPDAVPTSQAL